MFMHVLFHTQYFAPETGAPSTRIAEMARCLHKRGTKVTVLTAMPNHPLGKIYPGYGGILQKEDLDYATVIRTWILPGTGYGMKRLANYFSFVCSSFITGCFTQDKPDVIITESPPLFLGIAGYLLSRSLSTKWILNVSDLWPKSACYMGLLADGKLLRLVYQLEAWLYRKAHAVTGQSDGIVEDIRTRFPRLQVEKISNGVDPSRFDLSSGLNRDDIRDRYGVNGELGVVYTGLHGLAQGLDQIIHGAAQIKTMPVRFVLVGDGPAKKSLIEQASELGLTNVLFLDSVPPESIPPLLSSMDVAIITLKRPIPGAVPSKLYEAMAAGKSIVYVGGGEGARIVQKYNVGLTVPPDNPRALAEAIEFLMRNPESRHRFGKSGRSAVRSHFDRDLIADHLLHLLRDLIKERN